MKKKWAIRLVICLTFVVCMCSAFGCAGFPALPGASHSQSTQTDAFTYKLNKDETGYIVTGYEGTEADIRIPDVHEDKPVTAIGQRAFYKNESIQTLIMGENVTLIDSYAFFGCTALKEATLNDGLQKIGASAFTNCTALTAIGLGKTLKTISGYSFYGCSALPLIYIPDSVEIIEASAFGNCGKLTIWCQGYRKGGWDSFFYCGRPVQWYK